MSGEKSCPLCDLSADVRARESDLDSDVDCPTCGSFRIATIFVDLTMTGYEDRRFMLSGLAREWSRRGSRLHITQDNIESLIQAADPPDGPLEALDRLLIYLEDEQKSFADRVVLTPRDYPLVYAKDAEEFAFVTREADGSRFIGRSSTLSPDASGEASWQLTSKGWTRVQELKKTSRESDRAFVAMSFNPDLNTAYTDGIKKALEATGYRPVRMDLQEHDEKIDDRILSEVRRSGLMVADFTEHRQGVYFEAGFAMGLGIHVIWTVEKADLAAAHFDTRQYNHIDWTSVDDLRERLIARIEAQGLNRT